MGPSGGSFSLLLAPWSPLVGPRTVFETSYLPKSDCARNSTFSNTFGAFGLPHGAPKAPKIGPRRVLDPLGSLFVDSSFSLRFFIVFDSVFDRFWTPKLSPKGGGKRCESPPGEVPGRSCGRLGALLGSTCGLGSFLHPLRPFLGPFLASSGAMFGLLRANFRFVGAVLVFLLALGIDVRLPLVHLLLNDVRFPVCRCRLSLFHLWSIGFLYSICPWCSWCPGPADCTLRDYN